MIRFFSIVLLFWLAASSSAYGQRINSKKAKKFYKEAYTHYGYRDHKKALSWAFKALEKDSLHVNTLILLTDIYNIQGDFDEELKVYRTLLRIDSIDLRSHVNTGQIYLNTGDFAKAVKKYKYLKKATWLPERYVKVVGDKLERSEAALYLVSNPKEFNPERLGSGVNSEDDEYWPFLTADGRKLYFTRSNVDTSQGKAFKDEDIFSSSHKPTSYQNALVLPKHINTAENEGGSCITQDGKTMFFTVCKLKGGCDIYTTQWDGSKWNLPRKLKSPINTPYGEKQPSLSYDGKTLFFTSNRPGGSGGMDIWVSRMNKDSAWANPVNLGSKVNTPRDEQSPFIHADNQTLYFSSEGHLGLGRGDFFVIRLNGKAEAQNLGFPLNDQEMQLGIYIDLEGQYGYYASVDPNLETGLDIYRFTLPEDVKPNPLKIVHGRVIDGATGKALGGAGIKVYNLAKNTHVVSYTTHKDGGFKFGLPAKTQFAIIAEAEGYIPYSINSSVEAVTPNDPIEIALWPLKKGGSFTMENIFFDFDSSALKTQSYPEIAFLAEFLTQNETIAIEIGGHTDNVGDAAYNQQLSEQRAKSVLKALEKNMNTDLSKRVSIKGYGAEKPIADNNTEEGRQLNRRTEVRIIEVN